MSLRYCKVVPTLSDTETVAYLVGALLGDGNYIRVKCKDRGFDYQIRLKTKDREFVESVSSSFQKIGLHPYIRLIRLSEENARWNDCWEIKVRSKSFYYWLKSLDYKQITISYETTIAFLRGLFEAEGCFQASRYFDKRRGKYYIKYTSDISNSDLELASFTALLIEDVGFHPWIRTTRNRSGTLNYRVYLSRKNEVKRFLEVIKPCIQRKKWHEIG